MSRHGYRVIFMTMSDGVSGFWIRYTSLWRGIEAEGGVWLTIFSDGPKGIHLKKRGIVFKVGSVYEVSGPNLHFSTVRREAFFGGDQFGWRLGIDGQPSFNTMPPLIRMLRRRSKYIMVHPHALFNGVVRFRGERYDVSDALGMVGYISSDRYLHHWVWVHCSGFDEDISGWIDILIASPKGEKNILFGALRYRNKTYRIGGLRGSKFMGEYDLGYLRGNTVFKHGVISFSFEADHEDIIVAKYEDPVGGYRYCHNTEVANANIVIKTEKGELYLSCARRTFMEIVTPNIIDESLTRIIES